MAKDKQSTFERDYFIQTIEKIFDPVPVPIILIDDEMRVIMVNDIFAKYLNFTKDEMLGECVLDLDCYTRWPQVFGSKTPEIAWKHKFENGHTAIVHRIPVLNERGDIKYGFGMVLFQDMEEFQRLILENKLLEERLLYYKRELESGLKSLYTFENIIGQSPEIRDVKALAQKISRTDSNVLLVGESGTGKEVFAHAIHGASPRKKGPFIRINCGAIPRELLESELFGYEGGAFTGSLKNGKRGKFELADGGTLFLDEIGDLPLDMQVKLLRVLQEREITPLGSEKTKQIDVRILSATHRNLEEMVSQGGFREDLFYRLNVISVEIPSLRKRRMDIPIFTAYLVEKFVKSMGKPIEGVSDEVLQRFSVYDWPGNIRELENVIERAFNMADGRVIQVDDIPENIVGKSVETLSYKAQMEEFEQMVLKRALDENKGHKVNAAKSLKMGKTAFYEKAKKYGL
jgi:transcriptional regulator with PAS, ATPase and Fis domain